MTKTFFISVNSALLLISAALITTCLLRDSWWHTRRLNIGLNGVCLSKFIETKTDRCMSYPTQAGYHGILSEDLIFTNTVLDKISHIRYSVKIALGACIFSFFVLFLLCFTNLTENIKNIPEKKKCTGSTVIHLILLSVSVIKVVFIAYGIVLAGKFVKEDESVSFGASFGLYVMTLVAISISSINVLINFVISKTRLVDEDYEIDMKVAVVIEANLNEKEEDLANMEGF